MLHLLAALFTAAAKLFFADGLVHSSRALGSLPVSFIVERGHSVLSDASVQLNRPRFLILLAAVSTGALAVLLVPEWHVPATADSRYWNALVAFALLGIVCDSSFLPIERVPFAS